MATTIKEKLQNVLTIKGRIKNALNAKLPEGDQVGDKFDTYVAAVDTVANAAAATAKSEYAETIKTAIDAKYPTVLEEAAADGSDYGTKIVAFLDSYAEQITALEAFETEHELCEDLLNQILGEEDTTGEISEE